MSQSTTTSLRVVRADAATSVWADFVRTAPDATFAHDLAWRGVIEDVLGHEFIALAAVDANEVCHGVLPLVRVRTPLIGHSLVSVLCLNYGGPIGSAAGRRLLVDAAVAEARASGASTLLLRNRTEIEGIARTDADKVMVLLDLPAQPDELWSRFSSKLRSQIRRPQKEGMEFRTGADQLDAFYTVFARNMRDLGTPVYSRRFFERVAADFPDAVVTGAVYHRGMPVGGGFGLMWRGEFEITWASTVREFNSLSPNMLLYWGFMQEMIARNITTFNFGRSSRDAGTHRFKMQWGGVEHALPWHTWHAAPEAEGGPSRAAQLVSSVWRRMPLALANALGPQVARRLPWW